MILKLKILIFSSLFFIACKNDKKQLIKESNDKSLVVETKNIQQVTEKKEVVNPKVKSTNIGINNIEKFLIYYSENYNNIYKRSFVNYNEQYYRINFDNVTYFLSELNKYSHFDDKFIDQLRNKFEKIDKTLDKIKQSDGVPDGLEYDFIIETQEIDEILEYLKNKKFTISLNEGIYIVNVNNVYKLSVLLNNEKIFKIGHPDSADL